MSFPVWRELKHRTGIDRTNRFLILAMSFPVWRELKLIIAIKNVKPSKTCNVLSRLKGIETLSLLTGVHSQNRLLAMSFPVWRELKLCCYNSKPQFFFPCNVLSRLKGIETLVMSSVFSFSFLVLAMSFPVWRELKLNFSYEVELGGIELAMSFPVWRELKLKDAQLHYLTTIFPCNVLSRLKGIETQFQSCFGGGQLCLQCAFPFEGNWNPFSGFFNF